MGWERNRPDAPATLMERELPNVPPGAPPSYPRQPGDEEAPEMGWERNRALAPAMMFERETPGPTPGAPPSYPRQPGDEEAPEWGWDRNRSGKPATMFERETPNDRTAAWAMAPDDETDAGQAPKPASAPEDDISEASEE